MESASSKLYLDPAYLRRLDGARLESTSSKLCFAPVCWRRPFDPLVEEILAESQILDTGAGVTGKEVESLRFCRRLDQRPGC